MARHSLIGVLCLTACAVAPSAAAGNDLEKIDRKILKEPAYQSKSPTYCLLLFGGEAATRVWLVLDGDVVYVDRNHNGDLTEPGERFLLKEEKHLDIPGSKECRLGDLIEADGKTVHRDLRITVWGPEENRAKFLSINVKIRGEYLMFTHVDLDRAGNHPQEAPIRHFHGPLTLLLDGDATLVRGDHPANLCVAVGTYYLRGQAWAQDGRVRLPTRIRDSGDVWVHVMHTYGLPEPVHPIARITFPAEKNGDKPITIEAPLAQRC